MLFINHLMEGTSSLVARNYTQMSSAGSKRGSIWKEAIDLDEEDECIDHKFECYFGKFEVHLGGGELRLEIHLKEHPNKFLQEDDIQLIDRNQYQQTQPITLRIKNSSLTDPLRRTFFGINNLAKFLVQNVKNSRIVEVDSQKLTLNVHLRESEPQKVAQLYFNCFKQLNKEELLRSLRQMNNTFSDIDIDFLDPDLLLVASGFNQQDLLELYREEEDDSSFSSDEEEGGQQEQSEEHTSEADQQGGTRDNISFASQLQPNHHQPPQMQQQPRTIFKQNEIPIYERFRGVDINIPRKEKIKLAEKMLRIGYCKQEIIRFFGGGADEMEAEGNRLPDYRNPESSRYKEIHLIVAKKQHQRHNQLLKRYTLPPVAELPDYAGEIVTAEKRSRDRRIKEMLVRCVKSRQFKRLDEIQQEMRRHNEDVSLIELKRHIEELKKKSSEKKEPEREHCESRNA